MSAKISEDSPVQVLTGDELVPVVKDGENEVVTTQSIANLVPTTNYPAGARAIIDFVSGYYFVDGAVVQDPSTLFKAVGGYGATWDADDIELGKGLGEASMPAFDGALLAAVLEEGATVVFEFEGSELNFDWTDTTSYDVEVNVHADASQSRFYNNDNQINLSGNKANNGGFNRVAMTVSADRLSISVNGVTTDTTPPIGLTWADLHDVHIDNSEYYWLRSMVVFPPLDDAELPALSALPVFVPGITSKVPQWITWERTFEDFQNSPGSPAMLLPGPLQTLIDGTIIHGVKVKVLENFEGGGLTAVTMKMGISGGPDDKFVPADFDVHSGLSEQAFAEPEWHMVAGGASLIAHLLFEDGVVADLETGRVRMSALLSLP